MKWHVRKIVFLAALPLLALFEPAGAQTSCCQPQMCGGYEWGNCWIQGDLLWWKARGSNINYYSDVDLVRFLDESNFAALGTSVKRKNVHFNRDYGVRIGVGYRDPCTCLDAVFNWTYFDTSAKGRPDEKKFVDPCYFEREYCTDTKWHLNLNFWDFEFGKTCFVDDCVLVRAFLGVRGARISQKYFGESEFVSEPAFGSFSPSVKQLAVFPVDFFADFKEKHAFYGGGPRIGLDGEWLMGCGLSLYGDADVSFIVGFTNHHVCNTIETFVSSSGMQGIAVREGQTERDECLQANRVITDLGGGIRWRPCNCICGYRWRFQLGWENHTIFGQKDVYFGDDLSLFPSEGFPAEIEAPLLRGPCKSSLAVFGVVFSAAVEF